MYIEKNKRWFNLFVILMSYSVSPIAASDTLELQDGPNMFQCCGNTGEIILQKDGRARISGFYIRNQKEIVFESQGQWQIRSNTISIKWKQRIVPIDSINDSSRLGNQNTYTISDDLMCLVPGVQTREKAQSLCREGFGYYRK